MIGFGDESVDWPMNCENGMAGMNCPKVPVGVELYVRLEATVCTLGGPLCVVVVSGRISSTPRELDPSEPSPKKLVRMSSRAMVEPGLTWIVVDWPDCVPSVAVRVKLSWYFIAWAVM